jgi:hypothetical protein
VAAAGAEAAVVAHVLPAVVAHVLPAVAVVAPVLARQSVGLAPALHPRAPDRVAAAHLRSVRPRAATARLNYRAIDPAAVGPALAMAPAALGPASAMALVVLAPARAARHAFRICPRTVPTLAVGLASAVDPEFRLCQRSAWVPPQAPVSPIALATARAQRSPV